MEIRLGTAEMWPVDFAMDCCACIPIIWSVFEHLVLLMISLMSLLTENE